MTIDLDLYRRKVRWQMRRGLLELDILMTRFINAEDGFFALTQEELHTLEVLLVADDQTLLQYLDGALQSPDPLQAALIEKMSKIARPFDID